MYSRWLINRTNPEYVRYLSQAASISTVFAQVLINRGLKTSGDINNFLYPSLTSLSDPFEFSSMKTAVERMRIALLRRERILIHGDYDVDGLTATAIMLQTLRTTGLDVHYFIPNRLLDGYGFHVPAVDMAKKLKIKLIITVDCGITSIEAVSYANKAGIDVIITDHHEPIMKGIRDRGLGIDNTNPQPLTPNPLFMLPEAVAVINPKLEDNAKLSVLSGAGVAFKFAQALAMDDRIPFSIDNALTLLDLAALGTLADVVPLTGENRIIVKEGLKAIHVGARPGIRALKEVAGLNGKETKAGRLAFTLVPRLNAAGRISNARDVVSLLLSEDTEESLKLSSWLDRLNKERQQIEGEVYKKALEQIREVDMSPAIVLAGEGWHHGVLGVIASKIAGKFHRPAFIFSLENNIAKGSARSIPSFDICKGLAETSDILLSFGGHKQAAGIKLRAEDLPAFEKAINRIFQADPDAAALEPVLEIDVNIRLSEVTHELVREFDLLEPFGLGNPEPLLGAKALEVINSRIVGNNHLKMKLKKESLSLEAIGFAMGELIEGLQDYAIVDAVFTPEINDWNSSRSLQIILKAVRPSA